MGESCAEGQYLDRLLHKCVTCSQRCHNHVDQLRRCSQFCVAWRCKAVSGQFYDSLLKKCLQCSDVCGSHPPTCAHACDSAVTRRPAGAGLAVAAVTGRGRTGSGSLLSSEALMYGLLGLCITALVFSLTAAILLLLRRAKHRQLKQEPRRKQQPNRDGQSSNDSLMARADEVSQEGSVQHERQKATETCVHCFSEHTTTPATHTLYQQAHGHHGNGPLHTHPERSRAIRIICSPTQSST